MRLQKLGKSGVLLLLLTFYYTQSVSQNEAATKEINEYRSKQQKEFRDKKNTPLLPADRRKFKGLNYYPIDLKYRVSARFIKTENPVLFIMKTTTNRLPQYLKYGEVHFKIDEQAFKLEVYQSPEISKRPGYEDYLFIPFTDLTNGHET
jgi:uncharacterized protein